MIPFLIQPSDSCAFTSMDGVASIKLPSTNCLPGESQAIIRLVCRGRDGGMDSRCWDCLTFVPWDCSLCKKLPNTYPILKHLTILSF